MTTAIKVQDLKVGDVFISRGSKLTVARIKSSDETTINLFCLNHLLSSYISIKFIKSNDVTLVGR